MAGGCGAAGRVRRMTLYTYVCGDGVWRTRCRRHMAKVGPRAPARDARIEAWEGEPDGCVICRWEEDQQFIREVRSV